MDPTPGGDKPRPYMSVSAGAGHNPSSRARAVKFASTMCHEGWVFGQSLTGRTPIRSM